MYARHTASNTSGHVNNTIFFSSSFIISFLSFFLSLCAATWQCTPFDVYLSLFFIIILSYMIQLMNAVVVKLRRLTYTYGRPLYSYVINVFDPHITEHLQVIFEI